MKTITVKGVGTVLLKPDFVILSLYLESKEYNYEAAMMEAGRKVDQLTRDLAKIGFEKESVKTTDFHVEADYETKKDSAGNYYRQFNGYAVRHHLKVSFDFDTKALSEALAKVATCIAEPELSISFTVKEPSGVHEAILQSAAENARKKAEILCAASGSKLGELLTVDYNWDEVSIYSKTRYDMSNDCLPDCAAKPMSIDIEPDDIRASDTATFVWQMV